MPVARIITDNADFASRARQKLFRAIVIFVSIIFIGRLAYLQIIEGNVYKIESETQAIKPVIIEPFRGIMLDREGEILVNNEPSFTITLTQNDFRRESLPLLASILETDTNEVKEAFNKLRYVSKFIPVKVFKDIDYAMVARLREYADYLPGIDIVIESKRVFQFDANMAHMIGYNREVSRAQLQSLSYYRPGDQIGKTGLEKSYEDLLRGNKGIQYVAVNKFGQKVASFDGGKKDQPASHGFDLHLTIDKKLQEYGEHLLHGKRGSIVAINPNNGEIIAMVSKPDYDLNNFTGRIPADIFNSLINDPAKPLYHRAIMSRYPPGSTWKMLIALAGLQEGIITKSTRVPCHGLIKLGTRTFKCHGAHGRIGVKTALRVSCNVFFYELGMKLGLEKIEDYCRMFGFGDATGVDLPDENASIIPTLDWALKQFGEDLSVPKGYLCNWGIGQGRISVTPLQMAVYTSTIANGGVIHQPHLVSHLHNNITDKIEPMTYKSERVPIKEEYFDLIKDGMYEVVHMGGGTATNGRIMGVKVCGKTGTAQNPHGKDHSWFVAFAPKKDPQIAIAVIVENAGFGATVAVPVARRFMHRFFYPDMPDVSTDNESSTVTYIRQVQEELEGGEASQ